MKRTLHLSQVAISLADPLDSLSKLTSNIESPSLEKNKTNIAPGGEDHGKHWSAWFREGRDTGGAGVLGRRRRNHHGAGRGEGEERALPPARRSPGRNAGGAGRDAGAAGARGGHRPLYRSAAL